MIDLGRTDDPLRFTFAVTPHLSVGPPDGQFLFGGAGMGAAIAALEAATARPVVWATAQYLAFARPPAELDLTVVVPVAGRYSSQARVTARAGDREILTVNAALGSRPEGIAAQWATMPVVPPPADCPPVAFDWARRADDINAQVEQRAARGRFGAARNTGGPSADGTSTMWVRPAHGGAIDRVMLAVMADFLPGGIGPCARRGGRRQQPRQHDTFSRLGADPMGAVRHGDRGAGERLRPRPDAAVCRRRHLVGDGEPVDDRAVAGGEIGCPSARRFC